MLNVLHLPHRTDRLELLLTQFKEQGITNYKLWDGKIGQSMKERRSNVAWGHKQIVQHAKDNNLPFVIIAEDDITFTSKGAWAYYVMNMPQDFDIYFGMIYSSDKDAIVKNRIVKEVSGFTLYTVNSRFYDTFLDTPPDKHIDRVVTGKWANFKFLLPDKFMCYQNSTQSDNTMGKPDLSYFLRGREMFTLSE